MGRILYDEISEFELASLGRTEEEIIKDRWGLDNEIYAKVKDDSRNVIICWYHSTRYSRLVASKGTTQDLEQHNIDTRGIRTLPRERR